MRIALTTCTFAPNLEGGGAIAATALARELARRGHDVHVITLPLPDGMRELDEPGLTVHRIAPHGPVAPGAPFPSALKKLEFHLRDSFDPGVMARVGALLDVIKPDVVNSHAIPGLSGSLWLAAERRGIPVVHYIHELWAICANAGMFRNNAGNCRSRCWECRVITAPRRLLSRRVDTLIALSAFGLTKMVGAGRFTKSHLAVLPNAFENVHFTPRPRPPGEGLRLGFLGRIVPNKGLDVLARALVAADLPQWRLLVAGSGDPAYVDEVLGMLPPGRVERLGWIDPGELFRRIDLLVVPSVWQEPMGRILYEAAMHGVPVLASRVGGMPEIVVEGATGWTVPGGDSAALAEQLRRLATHPEQLDLPHGAYRSVVDRVRPENLIPAYERVFEAAADRGRERRRAAAR
ncbi:glycosyl transferase [Alsobacter metallidurans]|uniref:Glycosyl transferase n=1 Tax=Alsobacter metallidurans TaxID=340221 RepID=A0A917IBD2_9HYPH|nr:glycosyltransferase family 4 protein [Alsobacter metallidurans]GGH33405.1 glycosyl transferase [Alsobacter metallidurans]